MMSLFRRFVPKATALAAVLMISSISPAFASGSGHGGGYGGHHGGYHHGGYHHGGYGFRGYGYGGYGFRGYGFGGGYGLGYAGLTPYNFRVFVPPLAYGHPYRAPVYHRTLIP
jgi:hypothetical protein